MSKTKPVSKPTPGPLACLHGSTGSKVTGPAGVIVAFCGPAGSYGEASYLISPEEAKANSILFHAAPDLLEVLLGIEWISESENDRLGFCPWCARERSQGHDGGCRVALALAKAEGR